MDTETAAPPILSLKGIVAGYGQMTILNETTFDVRRAAITTVIGPNGAGKSTVFKTIFGLLRPRAGEIVFDGHSVTGASPAKLLGLGICYIPQGRNIFPELTVRHNLELGGITIGSTTDLSVRIDAAMTRFPVLARKSNHQASTLSGGEQKLLEIARGLLLDPKLILVDEPSIGLSPLMVREIFALLQDLRERGVSICMVEQNARSALNMSDDGIVLELGQTRMTGRAADLLADPRVGELFLGGNIEEPAQ